MKEHEWIPEQDGLFPCRFNEGCHCDLPTCGCCGWNPEVARRRLLETIKKGEERNESKKCSL